MKKVFIIILFFNLTEIYSVIEINKIYALQRKCQPCSDYFDILQLQNNILIRINQILEEFETWLRSPESAIYLTNKTNDVNDFFHQIKNSFNEIYTYKSKKLSGAEDSFKNLVVTISNIDPILPDFRKFTKIGFLIIIKDLIKTYDDLSGLSKPYEYDDWLREITSIKPIKQF